MNPIRTNKPVFFGEDGDVLKSGKIYIGQPNQWPLSFPKTVTFQDSAGSQFTAAQPLTTNDQGRITYNGKSIMALVDGDYSILVRDRNGVTVGEGYTPFVANANAGGAATGDVTQVGLLLPDIKQLNVMPGETVRNVGKSTTLDGLGADWLVVSNTGGSGDDVDLIDFDNGAQGQRIGNVLYEKDAGTAAKKDVGTDTGDVPEILYEEVAASGDFSEFTLKCMKIGNLVTIFTTTILSHSPNASPGTVEVVIPAAFRPASNVNNVYDSNGSFSTIRITGFGALALQYTDYTGEAAQRTNSASPISITYGV